MTLSSTSPADAGTAMADTTTTRTGGGSYTAGSVTAGRDFIGRDQINLIVQQVVQVAVVRELPPSNLHLINFGRPLTERQRSQIEQALGYCIGKTINIPAEFDDLRDFGPQVM